VNVHEMCFGDCCYGLLEGVLEGKRDEKGSHGISWADTLRKFTLKRIRGAPSSRPMAQSREGWAHTTSRRPGARERVLRQPS
jgi:hypothetical protein